MENSGGIVTKKCSLSIGSSLRQPLNLEDEGMQQVLPDIQRPGASSVTTSTSSGEPLPPVRNWALTRNMRHTGTFFAVWAQTQWKSRSSETLTGEQKL